MLRAVLSNDVTRDDIDDAMARCQLHLTNVVPGSDDVPAQLIYATTAASHLYLIEDGRLGVIYVATNADDGEDLLARLRAELPFVEDALLDVLDAPASDAAAVAPALAALVLCAAGTPKTMERLSRALESPSRDVRAAALVAVTYAPTRALYSPLAKIRDADDDLELRARAARVLAAILGAKR